MKVTVSLCIFAGFAANYAEAATQAFGLIGEAKKHSVLTRPAPDFRHGATAATATQMPIVARGGACDDTNAALLGKVGAENLTVFHMGEVIREALEYVDTSQAKEEVVDPAMPPPAPMD